MYTLQKIPNKKYFVLFILVSSFSYAAYLYFPSWKWSESICFNNDEVSLSKLRKITKCTDNFVLYSSKKIANYWVLYNYVTSVRRFKCEESVTYATHCDYTYLNNLPAVVERWKGPVSVAVYAPGTDFDITLKSIAYLRNCTPLVKELVTFHIYFDENHFPNKIPTQEYISKMDFDCLWGPPFENVSRNETYVSKYSLVYPINVGRNVARSMSETHFVLTSDVELYPSLNLIPQFFKTVAGCEDVINRYTPAVFVLHVFEVAAGQDVPFDKTELQKMLNNGVAVPFHKYVCSECHAVPNYENWRKSNFTKRGSIHTISKRKGKYSHWEPFYIGTKEDPAFDERLSWEGKNDKIVQAYTMCLLGYSFMILEGVFLVHKPGIKGIKQQTSNDQTRKRQKFVDNTNELINKVIRPNLRKKYGHKHDCLL